MPNLPHLPHMPIMPIYAALLALLFVYLSWRTIGTRRRLQIALGDKDHPEMQRAVRVHANFAEYVPLGLILLHLVEARTPPMWLMHALCLFVAGGPPAARLRREPDPGAVSVPRLGHVDDVRLPDRQRALHPAGRAAGGLMRSEAV